jgi:hypothetical protein
MVEDQVHGSVVYCRVSGAVSMVQLEMMSAALTVILGQLAVV